MVNYAAEIIHRPIIRQLYLSDPKELPPSRSLNLHVVNAQFPHQAVFIAQRTNTPDLVHSKENTDGLVLDNRAHLSPDACLRPVFRADPVALVQDQIDLQSLMDRRIRLTQPLDGQHAPVTVHSQPASISLLIEIALVCIKIAILYGPLHYLAG